jgi:hypothetical protein
MLNIQNKFHTHSLSLSLSPSSRPRMCAYIRGKAERQREKGSTHFLPYHHLEASLLASIMCVCVCVYSQCNSTQCLNTFMIGFPFEMPPHRRHKSITTAAATETFLFAARTHHSFKRGHTVVVGWKLIVAGEFEESS